MAELNDTVTLVTGAGGHLAEAVLSTFARAGSRLVLLDLQAPEERARTVGGTAISANLLDADDAGRAVQAAFEVHGRLDHVLHLVGGFSFQPAHEATDADFDKLIGLNLRTLVNVGRAALPLLRKRGKGLLAGVSAGQAFRGGGAGVALYAAAKAGVATWLKSVDLELETSDVKVTVLYPMGIIDTEPNRFAMPTADRATWIDPQDLAAALLLAATTSRRGRLLEIPVYPGRAGA
ncbi:MAG: SDR family NAD(P)-dependent oxidoreductase [Deltaproteobacteria bacterium]|nr:MAG: SDR family NAD(P)-dependent oxidoreductase [Deltaproteobacteria bacterium]